MPCPPLWPCTKVLNLAFSLYFLKLICNGYSFLSLILAKLLLLYKLRNSGVARNFKKGSHHFHSFFKGVFFFFQWN